MGNICCLETRTKIKDNDIKIRHLTNKQKQSRKSLKEWPNNKILEEIIDIHVKKYSCVGKLENGEKITIENMDNKWEKYIFDKSSSDQQYMYEQEIAQQEEAKQNKKKLYNITEEHSVISTINNSIKTEGTERNILTVVSINPND